MPDILDNLTDYHDAVIADLSDHYAGRVETVEPYDPFPDPADQTPRPVITPALLLEIDGLDPGEDDGTGRTPIRLSCVLHCLLSARTPRMQEELRSFAADVIGHVRWNRWGVPGAIGAPEALSAGPGGFDAEVYGYDSFAVRWEQPVYVGEQVWAGGIAPLEIWLGIAPRIGAAHVDDYWRVDEVPNV